MVAADAFFFGAMAVGDSGSLDDRGGRLKETRRPRAQGTTGEVARGRGGEGDRGGRLEPRRG